MAAGGYLDDIIFFFKFSTTAPHSGSYKLGSQISQQVAQETVVLTTIKMAGEWQGWGSVRVRMVHERRKGPCQQHGSPSLTEPPKWATNMTPPTWKKMPGTPQAKCPLMSIEGHGMKDWETKFIPLLQNHVEPARPLFDNLKSRGKQDGLAGEGACGTSLVTWV